MNAKIYKCFIGSPGDTIEERKYCKEVLEHINQTIGEKFNFRVESLMWEDTRPSFGDDAQEVINRQLLLREYNVFIGIMWSRFGSPTLRADSGTIEEFEDAYQKYKATNDLEICMYFNKQDIPVDILEPEQIVKVIEFKKRVSSLGGLYHEYKGAEQFKDDIRTHLTKYFLEKYDKDNASSREERLNNTNEIISGALKDRLDNALSILGQNPCWVEPVLSNTNSITSKYAENYESRININVLIDTPTSIIIKSPPQFGLTSLSHFLIIEAWKKNDIWIYLDATKIDRSALRKSVLKELKSTFFTEDLSLIKCIILDSWKNSMHGGMKMLKSLTIEFADIPLVVMQTIDANDFLQEPASENINREFQVMHLLALPKTEIRKMVASYNETKYIDEEDKVLNKIVKDIDTLNMHRTPMNCLTLLKVSEKYFSEKTINRSDMLHKVLFVLFDLSNIPTYQIKPDLKDCEFVLGIFCENMIRKEKYSFTKDEFISYSQQVLKDSHLELDINTLFDILYQNGIIIGRFSEFTFRARYWMFYFAANRMLADAEFCSYVFDTGKYINFPEIIEFYTGIDRRRTDALEILNRDLAETCNEVLNKLGLPEHVDPYLNVEWNPSPESIEKARNELSENVQTSKLPSQIKDQHADASQNQLRPYDQGIHTILHEYSLAVLMRKITAASRALRNSSYADAAVRKDLLDSIINSYEQVAKAIMILTPELAINGRAAFGGQAFNLDDGFGDTVDRRINNILQYIPINVVNFFKDDIDSEKLGRLLLEKINSEQIPLNKHMLILLLTEIRPPNWRRTVEAYINSLPKNSFYLFAIMRNIRYLYFYDYTSETVHNELKQLMLLGYSKHKFGNSKPSKFEYQQFAQSMLQRPKKG